MVKTSSPRADRREEIRRMWGDARDAHLAFAPGWLGPEFEQAATGIFPAKAVSRVLAIDPSWTLPELKAVLAQFARWPAEARLLLGFANAGSASRLEGLLTGTSREPAGWPDDQVRSLISAAGLQLVARQGFPEHAGSALAGKTHEALRGLFTQLNPTAGDDWVLYTLGPVAPAPVAEGLVEGLLSVVMRNHSTTRVRLFDHAVFSLATQGYRQLEIVLVTQAPEPDALSRFEAVMRRHQHLGQFSFRVIVEPSARDIRARLVNIGIEHARGQYLAILDDDDVVYPHHYTRLIEALRESTAAWAFAPIQRAYFTDTASGDLYCKRKSPMPNSEHFDLARLTYDNYVTCHSYVIDRTRIGRFPVRFEEQLDKGEDYAMLLRLLALFHPVAVGGGPSAEYRIRDNGSNTIIHETHDAAVAARLRREWESAITLKNKLTDPLQMIMSKATFIAESRKGLREGDGSLDRELPELRYRLADRANELLKRRLPFIHSRLRAVADPQRPPQKADPDEGSSS